MASKGNIIEELLASLTEKQKRDVEMLTDAVLQYYGIKPKASEVDKVAETTTE